MCYNWNLENLLHELKRRLKRGEESINGFKTNKQRLFNMKTVKIEEKSTASQEHMRQYQRMV